MNSREPAGLNLSVGKPAIRNGTDAGRSFSCASSLALRGCELQSGNKNSFVSHDDLILHVTKVVTKRIPDGLQSLAVTTPLQNMRRVSSTQAKNDIPGRIELNEHVFRVIKDDFVKLLTDKGKHALVLSLRDRLALQLGKEFTLNVVSNQR